MAALEYAAGGGFVRARWMLAQMYDTGDGVPQDRVRALELYRDIACDSIGDDLSPLDAPYLADAFVALGDYYYYYFGAMGVIDCGVAADAAPAPQARRDAAEEEPPAAARMAGGLVAPASAAPAPAPAPGDDPFAAVGATAQVPSAETAVAYAQQFYWHAATELGDARAQASLAQMFYAGEMGQPDPNQAAGWARLSADQGNPTAQALLGHILFEGDGVLRQAVLGLAYLTIARARSGGTDPTIRRLHEEAFSLADEEERRKALDLAQEWLANNPAPFR